MPDDEITHYGVKGMRWGIRRENRKDRNRQIKEARKELYDGKHSRNLDKAFANYHKSSANNKKALAILEKHSKENLRLQKLANQKTTGEKWIKGLFVVGTSSIVLLKTRQIIRNI